MAITVNWPTKVINVPRADMLLVQSVPTEIRELDLDAFRLELKSIEANEGMPFDDMHRHNPPVTVGGVTLARVVEIINGYTVTFEDGQYAVNLVGANSNVADVTNVNQVSVRSANSAGLTYSKQIEDQSYLDGRVWINTTDGQPGTQYPLGTPADPVNNSVDAHSIVLIRNLPSRFWLRGILNYGALDTLPAENWLGETHINSIINLSGTNISNTIFNRIHLSGNGIGPFTMEYGFIENFINFEGDCYETGFLGTTIIPPGAFTSNRLLVNCYSAVPGTQTPVFDMNNATNINWQFRSWTGGLEIKNYTNVNNLLSIDLLSGHVKIDSSCTAGTIVIRGTGKVTNNSVGVTIVENVSPVWSTAEKNATLVALTSIADATALLQKYQENRSVIDKINKTLIIYDDDGITPILTFSLLDSFGAPSTDEVAERLPL